MNADGMRGGLFQTLSNYRDNVSNQIRENKKINAGGQAPQAFRVHRQQRLTPEQQQKEEDQRKRREDKQFELARKHFYNALNYRGPREITPNSQQNHVYTFIYELQTSSFWQTTLLLLSYFFMYLVLLTFRKPGPIQSGIEFMVLGIFWGDVAMEVYHKGFENFRIKSRFQSRFYYKLLCLSFLTVDQIAAVTRDRSQDFIRPFLVMRCLLPTFYDKTLRKNMKAMLFLYKDIIVFSFFYGTVILAFTYLLHRFAGNPQKGDYDQFTENYQNFGIALFGMYALSSFQAYPDNQLRIIRQQPLIYLFFILFIILNLFLFVTIPTSLLFNEFKEIRSRIILVDQIKQQSSLILAFTCLCENRVQITTDKYSRFLMYCFRNKSGYIDEVVTITQQIDENNNGKIQITQFMQTLKIMNSHPSIYPPSFDDWQPWLEFRDWINNRLHLKDIVSSLRFKVLTCLLILFSIVNCFLYVFSRLPVFQAIDNFIAIVFVVELVAKLVGLGPENFFKDPWNKLDFYLILIILVVEMQPPSSKSTQLDVLFKLTRCYRIALLPQYLIQKIKHVSFEHFSIRISRLVTQLLMTIPIVFQFFPMYLIVFYFFGIIGLQLFGNIDRHDPETSSYSKFNQVANFDSFLYSQFYMVQILIEAGWSLVAIDHTVRFPLPMALTLFFFTLTHFSITLVISSLVKGVTWQVYQTLQEEHNNEVIKNISLSKMQEKIDQQNEQIENYNKSQQQVQRLQNLVKRQIFEIIADQDILRKMAEAAQDRNNDFLRRKRSKGKQMIIPMLYKRLGDNQVEDIEMVIRKRSSQDIGMHENKSDRGYESGGSFDEGKLTEQLNMTIKKSSKQEQSTHTMKHFFESNNSANKTKQIKKLAENAEIRNAYRETTSYPAQFVNFLISKVMTVEKYEEELKRKREKKQGEDIVRHLTTSLLPDSPEKRNYMEIKDHQREVENCVNQFNFMTDAIKSLVDKATSSQFEKTKIFNGLIKSRTITPKQAEILKTIKKGEKSIWLDDKWIQRQTFLNNTSEKLIEKFQIQYFSKIYGKGFKDVSKKLVGPMIRMQSKLTYCLRNALRCVQMKQLQFFTILNKVEDRISSKLLKKGSLFKFVYQIDSINEIWLTIGGQKSESQGESGFKFGFVKNGVWLWHKRMDQDKIYIGEDLFKIDPEHMKEREKMDHSRNGAKDNRFFLQRYLKSLYQSFESLAIGLPNKDNFFTGKPTEQVYNLYCLWKDVQPVPRQEEKRFQISKIMAVLLSREGKREVGKQPEQLDYELTDIKTRVDEQSEEHQNKYEIYQSYKDLFNRINKLETMDDEQIQQDDEIIHPFKVNLMRQISDILASYQSHFVYRIEEVLNKLDKDLPMAISQRLSQISHRQSQNFGRLSRANEGDFKIQIHDTDKKLIDDKEVIKSESCQGSSIGDFDVSHQNNPFQRGSSFGNINNMFNPNKSSFQGFSSVKVQKEQQRQRGREAVDDKILPDGKSLANSEEFQGSSASADIHGNFNDHNGLI